MGATWRKTTCYLLLLSFISFLVTTRTAPAEEIRFGHAAPPYHGLHQGALALAGLVEAGTGGRLKILVTPWGDLGPELSLLEQVQQGQLEMAAVSITTLARLAPRAALFDLPFLWPSPHTARLVLADPKVRESLFSLARPLGLTPLGYTENGFYDLTCTRRPLLRPQDLAGLKIRVEDSPARFEAFRALGAEPVLLPAPMIRAALDQGVIQAQENPLLTSIGLGLLENRPFLTLSRHGPGLGLIVVNTRFWRSLGPEPQRVFEEAAAECLRVNRAADQALVKKLPGLDLSLAEYLKAKGVKAARLGQAEREAFAAVLRPVWENFGNTVDKGLHDLIMEKIKENSVPGPEPAP
ncbi:MAG: TRAP transporter substrate-binding protein DctP, partial [Thermodesulfobacteriota bacterium]